MANDNYKKYKYKGCIHIHSNISDGSGNIETISKAAKNAGLTWIIITDHNYFDTQEGIYNGVYVLKGEEISPANNSHYLALGIDELIEPSNDSQTNVNNVRKNGGFGFAAHPNESRIRKNKWKPIVWNNKSVIPDGVEIWNWFSSWGDNLNDRNIFKLAYSYFFKNKIISNPSPKTLNWWDELNQKSSKIVPAIGGVDAHALKVYRYILPLTVFPYKTCFKTITNVIPLDKPLSNNFDIAKKQILTAIKNGNNLIINRKICSDIPQIDIVNANTIKSFGETIALTDFTYLDIKVHRTADIKVILNGKEYATNRMKRCRIPITKEGKYRVEFSYSGRGYAYTNPIQVIEE